MGKNILLIGAGRSSTVLIKYFFELCKSEGWSLTILARENLQISQSPVFLSQFECDVFEDNRIESWIEKANIVVSMLPARSHIGIAKLCLEKERHFVSASYVSDEMKALDEQVKAKSLVFLNECGLDPGLDHMSAMKLIDEIQDSGGVVTGFESFAGGLIAPCSDDNPWNYKLTWNPRNVVLAGQGGAAKFKQKGTYKYIPYQQLFKRTELIEIEGYGKFEGYANRDSLKYREKYKLKGIETIFRGTLRRVGFCKAWNKLIEIGMTDDTYVIPKTNELTYRDFTNLFLSYHPSDSVEMKLLRALNISQDDFSIIEKLNFLGLFSNERIAIEFGTPAQVLQEILEKKWLLSEKDKDMIVMWHKFNYTQDGKQKKVYSSLVVEGENQKETAMAKTVGLPVGIATKLILKGKVSQKGVQIPISKEFYRPILNELEESFGVLFSEVQKMD